MKTIYPATLLCDFYKISHKAQYPKGTQKIYSTWTPRVSRIEGIDAVVAFGFQAGIQEYLVDYFRDHFFNRPLEEVVAEYRRYLIFSLGIKNPDASHIIALHNLGYLPLMICAVKEGTIVPIRVPMLTIENTIDEFYWVTNYVETLLSLSFWKPCTNATIALEFRRLLDAYADITGGNADLVQFQGHDFSMRGMDRVEASAISGASHLLSFTGTDSIPAIALLEAYYGANIEKELVGCSIPATEHSVMCTHGQDEYASIKEFITETYPEGFVSVVSDTWDLWKVVTETLPSLKEIILARNGKLVIRPDSGDPADIICGNLASPNPHAQKGVIELLWDIFGGTVNKKGYKELDSHIGAIYGDAITLDRCDDICRRLMLKGFASTNMVFGIGSYTYQYNTRDTFGFAIKSTYACVDGEERFIFKDPVTDIGGVKKSQTGMVVVLQNLNSGEIIYKDELTEDDRAGYYSCDMLNPIFIDGKVTRTQTLSEIRQLLQEENSKEEIK